MIIENVMVFRDVMACGFLDVLRECIASTFSAKYKANLKVVVLKRGVVVSYKTLCSHPRKHNLHSYHCDRLKSQYWKSSQILSG
jgi:hypothetical protein